jgi:hypothetical protein
LEVLVLFPMGIIAMKYINTANFELFMSFLDCLAILLLSPDVSILPEVSQYFPVK